MYFSNIVNEEIQHFHGIAGADFTMSLTDILTSKMFKVESIIADKIYRIYPLFYCKHVISSNANDKILETRCLILQKGEHETYLSFITDSSSDNIIFNENIQNIKNIGDILTTEEFNAFVYRLRKNGTLKGSLNFEEKSSIRGVYATYEFNNVDGQLRNDTGIIVNNKVKNNPLTVKLVNPFFLNAKYTLTFTVRSISGANVCEDNKGDFISKTSFNVDLVEDSDVAISLTDYINDSVLDFDVSVSISFNVPEIVNSNFNLNLTSDKSVITLGDGINLTARLTGEDNVKGYLVQFFENNVFIGSETTNNLGEAVLNYVPNTVSNHIYSATVIGLKSECNIAINKLTPSLSFSADKINFLRGEILSLTGKVTVDNEDISNMALELYDNNNYKTTLTTNNKGEISYQISDLSLGNHNLKLVLLESDKIEGAESSITISVKANTNITSSEFTNENDGGHYVDGRLTDDAGVGLANKKIYITYIVSRHQPREVNVTTNDYGYYSAYMPGYVYMLYSVEFRGDVYYNSCSG